MPPSHMIDRRQALLLASGGMVAACSAPRSSASAETGQGRCILTPESVEGPFYLDPRLERAGIDEDRPGVPLHLRLAVVDAGACTPIPGARVDVWHCDAAGAYSGYPGQPGGRDTRNRTFLRGHQPTDRQGTAGFRTIWPGWYPGRAPHIHFKILLDDTSLLTGQLYFPDALNRQVFASHPAYERRWTEAAGNAQDGIFRDGAGTTIASVTPDGPGYEARLTVGVDRST